MDDYLLWRGPFGERHLFIRPFHWFARAVREPEFKHFKPLPALPARLAVEELLASERGMLFRLYQVANNALLTSSPDEYTERRVLLEGVLDAWDLGVGAPAPGYYHVFKEEIPRPKPPPPPPPKPSFKPAPLNATQSWVAVECVEDSDEHRPASGVQLEIVTASADVRSARTNDQGSAFFDRIAPGRVTIRVLGMDGSRWRPALGEAARPSGDGARVQYHTVQQGEFLSKIAHQYGLARWQDIWQHERNEALRQSRKSPNVLYPGDELVVPATKLYDLARETEQTHRLLIRPESKVWVRLHLLDEKRKPIETGTYQILASGKVLTEGALEQGKIEVELPSWVQDAVLVVRVGEREVQRHLRVGSLDPADKVSGMQARLANLGYYDDEVDGREADLLMVAAREFRHDLGMKPSDALDGELQEALAREHKA